jgi:FGGY-family pentulose kinase
MSNNGYIIGCDVGTGSVRAGVFTETGKMMAMSAQDIKIWHPQPDFVEQSSEDIWKACCVCVKNAVKNAGLKPEQIKGVGFDATCSMVVLDENDRPLSVSPTNNNKQNVIVWMDHRATEEAHQINQTGHDVLKYIGGTISPEMEIPKLLWLKTYKPKTWEKAGKFLDLADFMTFHATGVDVRSLCTTTCKWTYLGHKKSPDQENVEGWDDSFFNQIGLADLVDEEYRRIGTHIKLPGQPVGEGLSKKAAGELELPAGTPVGVGMIDAHAGGLGLLGIQVDDESINLEYHLALIGGTSSCHMTVSKKPRFIDGVWGPYYSAMIPDMWLNEGGQSATGALIDHIIFSSKQSVELKEQAGEENKTVYQLLNERLYRLAEKRGMKQIGTLTYDLHVLPYFHGNRSPRANPSLTGSICGLTLSSTLDDLALLYLATIQAIAYGTRHIIETLNESGYTIDTIMATGGGTKNKVFLQQHADICRCKIVLPNEPEAVLLGSAVLGAVASEVYSSIFEAMENMNKQGKVIEPGRGDINDYHQAKYKIFHEMHRNEVSYNNIMDRVAASL